MRPKGYRYAYGMKIEAVAKGDLQRSRICGKIIP